jgi:hypothetical protein
LCGKVDDESILCCTCCFFARAMVPEDRHDRCTGHRSTASTTTAIVTTRNSTTQ